MSNRKILIIGHIEHSKTMLTSSLFGLKEKGIIILNFLEEEENNEDYIFPLNPLESVLNLSEVEALLKSIDAHKTGDDFIIFYIQIIYFFKLYSNQEDFNWFLEFKSINGPRPPNKRFMDNKAFF